MTRHLASTDVAVPRARVAPGSRCRAGPEGRGLKGHQLIHRVGRRNFVTSPATGTKLPRAARVSGGVS